MTAKKDISFDEVSREFDRGIAGADALRADGLTRLGVMRSVKDSRMKREQARLAAKLPPGHPRLTEIDNRLQMNAAMMRDLKIEAARARTEVPQVDTHSWVLHGYVRDKAHAPVPNLTVALFNANGARINEINQGCTDNNGYYKIVATKLSAAVSPAYPRVLSKTNSVLFADNKPLTPRPNGIDYREMILSGEEQTCVPPPEPPAPPPPMFGPPIDPGTGSPVTGSGGSPSTGGGTPSTAASQPPRDYWVVRGRVTNRAGGGVGGIFVSLYDKDLFFDDRLGQAETEANGDYSLTYRTEDFRDLIEKKPDLYLKVIDGKGRTLRTIHNRIRYESGRVETIDIELD